MLGIPKFLLRPYVARDYSGVSVNRHLHIRHMITHGTRSDNVWPPFAGVECETKASEYWHVFATFLCRECGIFHLDRCEPHVASAAAFFTVVVALKHLP